MVDLTSMSTVGEIARKAGQPSWRVRYAIDNLSVREVRRVGTARIFDPATVSKIEAELERLLQRKALATQ